MDNPTINIDNIDTFENFQKEWHNLSSEGKVRMIRLTNSYGAFRRRYRNDLEGFVLECFEWKEKRGIYPSEDQLSILRNFQEKKRASIRALHGVGKTALAAWVIIWFSLTRDVDTDWKVVSTASSWRQLTKYLWPEVHKWSRKLLWPKIGIPPFRTGFNLLRLNLNLTTGQAFAVASDNHEHIEGAHADSILYVFDESKAIPDQTWDAAEGAFSTAGTDMEDGREAFVLSISTPGEPIGRFFDIQSRKAGYHDWWTYHIGLINAIEQRRVSKEWAENRKLQWGESSALYQNRVLGEFAQSEEDSIIPLAWIDAAVTRWGNRKTINMKAHQIGFDAARFGGDKSVMAFRSDTTITQVQKWAKKDLMHSTGRIMKVTSKNKGSIKIMVDIIGMGGGVYDRLKEQGRKVFAFNAAEATNKTDRTKELKFINKRAAGWWMMRELFEDGMNKNIKEEDKIAIPDNEQLIGDLASPKWDVTSSGKIKVEAKDKIRERLGRSPDDADAVIMAFWKERSPGISVG